MGSYLPLKLQNDCSELDAWKCWPEFHVNVFSSSSSRRPIQACGTNTQSARVSWRTTTPPPPLSSGNLAHGQNAVWPVVQVGVKLGPLHVLKFKQHEELLQPYRLIYGYLGLMAIGETNTGFVCDSVLSSRTNFYWRHNCWFCVYLRACEMQRCSAEAAAKGTFHGSIFCQRNSFPDP